MITYTLKIEALRQETSDTVTICFKQPGLKKVKYRAGQYLTLIFRINGRRYIRPYSFSSSPGIDPFLEVTIKRVPGGVVSNHILDTVNVGDMVEVMPPMGDFVVDESTLNSESQIVIWGAGSGITPLYSIAKYALEVLKVPVTLVYGNRDFESVIFLKQIKALQEKFSDLFTVWHFHTQLVVEKEHPNVIQGRISSDKVLAVMNNMSSIEKSYHYICGPTGLKESVKSALKQLGVNDDFIFSEDFEIVKDEKDFENIITRSVTFHQNGQSTTVEVVKGKSILEAGLDTNIELPYSCQTGSCSVCKALITNGEVKQIGMKNRPADLKPNEFLLCCAHPLTNDVEIYV
ncbi:ring-1,2-phenylacetyl-CoA epoxidase subunit PaaE [Mucilaginibacter gracilis]|uniref:Ring-1,2-phenylacetyl-CoA epoxidase subunit PaaE n=1 Tax=Mucilaginibacter gracilis TaxID=423350 RepID=A0A495J0V1_9SPHI|nr:ferredoxin--NADP reductase [Mucilaginibacter gracilis]RKR82241.1 ring-1,2-phenylacetyl-CoA epoxidase subunit PaaE [Mucilaginibacter gracilis]